ncbi:MAG: LytR C-terminal domain-containing protein [Cumulibacter sp.]
MLTQTDVQRRRIGGAIAIVIGAVLVVLAFMAFTGRLGATDASKGASDEARSAGADSSQSADPSEDTEDSGAAGSSDAQPSEDADSSEGVDPSDDADPSEPPAEVKAPLVVLNGGGTDGLAATGQTEFINGGWEVTGVDNYFGTPLTQSTVFYSSGDDQAQAAAEALAEQYSQLAVAEMPPDLGYTGVVVVLTGDWAPGQ